MYRTRTISVHIAVLGGGYLIAHFVQQLFLFEVPITYQLLFLFFAFLVAQQRRENVSVPVQGRRRSPPLLFVATGTIVAGTLIVVFFTVISPLIANKGVLYAQSLLMEDPQQAMQVYQKARSFPSPYYQWLRVLFFSRGNELMGEWEGPVATEFLALARGEFQNSQSAQPLNPRPYMEQAYLELNSFRLFGDISSLERAQHLLLHVLEVSPRRQEAEHLLAEVEFELGNQEEAIDILVQSIGHDYRFLKGWLKLADLYVRMGEEENARAVVDRARQLGIYFSQASLDAIFPPHSEKDF